jgi:hypothetical protein
MNDINYYALISWIIRILSTSVLLFYIIPKQFKEVMRPRTWITGLRWQILLLFTFSVVAAFPALAYQGVRTFGGESPGLRNIAGISGNLSTLGTTTLLVLVYNYKQKDE